MKSNIDQTEYEIHFAAELGHVPAELTQQMYGMGFRDDQMMGHGVVFSPADPIGKMSCPLTGLHISWDTFNREQYVEQRDACERLFTQFEASCVGYAHGEVIKPEWDLAVSEKPFDSLVELPILPFVSGMSRTPKKWDIHISAQLDSLDPRLQQKLCDYLRMYYIDLRKRSGAVNRVFTIQGTNSVLAGVSLFQILSEYLQRAGGMKGSVKFEQTSYWLVLGTPSIVPPVIDTFNLAA